MHDNLKVGQILQISAPRNNFTLVETADLSVFFAGGIGVTPFIPMIARLNMADSPWRMHYCARNRSRAALVDEIEQLAGSGNGQIRFNFDDTDGILDLKGTLAALPGNTHIYCCGPAPMLEAFRNGSAEAGIPPEYVHFEYFNANVQSASDGGFSIVLNKSGKIIAVNAGETILQALIGAGVNIPYSCEEGICGACETHVIEGTPDHRDMILSDLEKDQSKTMMVCCSGSKSPRLVLDL